MTRDLLERLREEKPAVLRTIHRTRGDRQREAERALLAFLRAHPGWQDQGAVAHAVVVPEDEIVHEPTAEFPLTDTLKRGLTNLLARGFVEKELPPRDGPSLWRATPASCKRVHREACEYREGMDRRWQAIHGGTGKAGSPGTSSGSSGATWGPRRFFL